MDFRIWIYEDFNLIFNSNINVKHNKFLYIHYYKIQHGEKNPMSVNKVIIVFTMEIMHK